MQVEERIKGLVNVAQLSEGDVIRGITGTDQTPDWCRVEAVISLSEDQTTYDGFTENHIVVDDTVHPYGKKGKLHIGPVWNAMPLSILQARPSRPLIHYSVQLS